MWEKDSKARRMYKNESLRVVLSDGKSDRLSLIDRICHGGKCPEKRCVWPKKKPSEVCGHILNLQGIIRRIEQVFEN
jgi:hypothetical protein